MSRIGQKPVPIPDGVKVDVSGKDIVAKGPKGELRLRLVDEVEATLENGEVALKPRGESKRAMSMWGMQRTLVSNLVVGVTEGFSINLEVNGVGYRAAVQGNVLNLQLGHSHPVNYPIPDGIDIACERPTAIRVSGADRQKVGQVAAEIRRVRPPEPYKGKGVRYANEHVERKEGKKK